MEENIPFYIGKFILENPQSSVMLRQILRRLEKKTGSI
jgi:hypothetical protein